MIDKHFLSKLSLKSLISHLSSHLSDKCEDKCDIKDFNLNFDKKLFQCFKYEFSDINHTIESFFKITRQLKFKFDLLKSSIYATKLIKFIDNVDEILDLQDDLPLLFDSQALKEFFTQLKSKLKLIDEINSKSFKKDKKLSEIALDVRNSINKLFILLDAIEIYHKNAHSLLNHVYLLKKQIYPPINEILSSNLELRKNDLKICKDSCIKKFYKINNFYDAVKNYTSLQKIAKYKTEVEFIQRILFNMSEKLRNLALFSTSVDHYSTITNLSLDDKRLISYIWPKFLLQLFSSSLTDFFLRCGDKYYYFLNDFSQL